MGAQQLEGYGQECFLAKDDTGNEVLLGASLTGTQNIAFLRGFILYFLSPLFNTASSAAP